MPDSAQELRTLLGDVNAVAVQELLAGWEQYRDLDAAVIRDAMLELAPELVTQYGALAADLAVDWYIDLDDESDFEPKPLEPPPPAQVEANVRWAMSSLFGVGEASPIVALSGSVQRAIFDTGRNTVTHNAALEGIGWYRHAAPSACAWCRVLATRKPVYRSHETALKSHDRCRCVAVPVRKGSTYTRPAYVDQWEKDYQNARDEVGGNMDDIVNFMRRQESAT